MQLRSRPLNERMIGRESGRDATEPRVPVEGQGQDQDLQQDLQQNQQQEQYFEWRPEHVPVARLPVLPTPRQRVSI